MVSEREDEREGWVSLRGRGRARVRVSVGVS